MLKRGIALTPVKFGISFNVSHYNQAGALVHVYTDGSVLVLTGSPMLHAFRMPERVDYVKLPCLARNVEGQYGARYLDLSLDADGLRE